MSRPLAIVTGTSSGIGAALAEALVARDWRVVGLSRRTPELHSPHYTHVTCDLRETRKLPDVIQQIIESHGPINALVNNAGLGHFAPHEELSADAIQEMVNVNLLAPLIITRTTLRSLKATRGHVILLSSFSALESSSFGAAYAATKAGLRHFGDSLFDEVRKSGVRVTTITPDLTRTPFYDHLTFAPEDDSAAAIDPLLVVEEIVGIMTRPEGSVTTHVVMRPQRVLIRKKRAAE